MHFCPDCTWTGDAPNTLAGAARLAVLDQLRPGEIVPSGICPSCSGHTLPSEIGPFPVPEGADLATQEPFEGWRWSATISLTPHAFIVGLSDRVLPRFAELAIDASGQRPRVELTASSDTNPFPEQEAQLAISIGDGEVAAFPAADPATHAVVFHDRGVEAGPILTRTEFDRLDRWRDRLLSH